MNDQTVRDGRGNPIAFERVGAAFSHARSQLLHLCAFDGEEILEVGVLGTGLSLYITELPVLLRKPHL